MLTVLLKIFCNSMLFLDNYVALKLSLSVGKSSLCRLIAVLHTLKMTLLFYMSAWRLLIPSNVLYYGK